MDRFSLSGYPVSDSPFRGPTNQRLLRGLFFETTLADKSSVSYTLKDRDHEGFPSLYRLYMEADDQTEYTFATSHLDGWDHWEILCECTWFKPYIARWRREIEIRSKARALLAIRAKANNPNDKEHYQANKFLINGGWKESKRKGAGRPSKAEVQSEAKRQAMELQDIDSDLQRVKGLN